MTSDNSSTNLHDLWQKQAQSSFEISPEKLHCLRKRLNRKLLVRDGTVWVLCLFEICWFAWILVALPQPLMKFGSALVILGMAYMTGQVWLNQRSCRASRLRAEASGNVNSLEFLRSELERQREFHRGIWFWSRLAVLMPGLLVFGVGAIMLFPWPDSLVGWSVVGVTVFVFPLAIWLNLKKSKAYQREIDALDTLRQSPQKNS
ncbi:MAG: hypothetical protein ABSF28_17815 [Terracidiphilus sp.]|jgi:hypothetical protein